MGKYEAELERIATNAEILSDLNACIAAIPKATEHLDNHATVFKAAAEFPGLVGDTADRISVQFAEEGARAANNAEALGRLKTELEDALTAVSKALRAYSALPDATIPTEQRVAILGGASLLFPGIGYLGGKVALDQYEAHLKRVREQAAKAALYELETETSDPADNVHKQYEKLEVPTFVRDTIVWETADGSGGGGSAEVLRPPRPGIGGSAYAPGVDSGSGSWDEPVAQPFGGSSGGVAAGVVGVGAIAGLGAGLGKIGGGAVKPGLTPVIGGPGGSGSGGSGAGGVGAGSRVSADSASTISRSSSLSGRGMNGGLSGGLTSGRAGLGGLGAGGSGLGGAGLSGARSGMGGASGGGGLGAAQAGSVARTGLGGASGSGTGGGSGTGAAGGAGKGGMMMGGAGAGGGSADKDKSRTSMGYRAPKIEADSRDRRRAPASEAGSRADFPETPSESAPV